jgi:hypothetical protein
MVQVIDRIEDAGGAECIEFRPYRSPVDPSRILANWQYGASVNGMASIATSQLGVPVDIEYRRAFNEAVQHGMPYLWVNDADGLFPPAARPTPP